MNKKERLSRIKDLIVRYPIDTQEEIVERLREVGIVATQATVSRDMKELGIVKIPDVGSQHYIYGLPKPSGSILQPSSVLKITEMDQFLHISVVPGTSVVVKRQIIDHFGEQIFSAMADDDSVLLIVKDPAFLPQLQHVIKGW